MMAAVLWRGATMKALTFFWPHWLVNVHAVWLVLFALLWGRGKGHHTRVESSSSIKSTADVINDFKSQTDWPCKVMAAKCVTGAPIQSSYQVLQLWTFIIFIYYIILITVLLLTWGIELIVLKKVHPLFSSFYCNSNYYQLNVVVNCSVIRLVISITLR